MRITAQWYGGPSYAAPAGTAVEHFSSLAVAKDVLYSRAENADGRTPCVEESEMLIWRADLSDTTDIYPDLRLYFGPRGGIRTEPC